MKKYLLIQLLLTLSLLGISTLHAQNGIIKGRVSDELTNEPIPFCTILLDDTDDGTTTDIDGNFTLEGLEPGLYSLTATYVGYRDETVFEIQVTNAKPAEVNIQMKTATQNLEEVVVKASPFKKTAESPVSLRTIGVAEIQRNPGANRDISRVVQSLPGVTTTASFRNDLIIRGGAPNENRFYLDDVEVPNINHFATQGASGGPVGLINVNFINEVDFYSGAFPANRGNALSSVFNFNQRDGRNDRLGATLMVSATDVGLTLEGPVGDKTTYLLSARRSYLQLLFQALDLPFLPIYNDFQAKIKHKIDKRNEIYFVGLGAIDNVSLNTGANETEEQRFILNSIPVNDQWNYTNGLVYKHYTDKGYWTFVLSRNMLNNEAEKYLRNDESSEENLLLRYRSQEIENKFRMEHDLRMGDYRVNAGLGYEYIKYNNSTFNRIFTNAGPQTIDFSSAFDMNRYFAFGQISRNFLKDRLSLSFGVRADGVSYSEEMSNPLDQLSPRFSMAYNFSDRFSFNFNTGIYYQLPPYTVLGYQEDGEFVNKRNGIKYIRNNHFVAGLEFNTATNSKITLEGYYKIYDDYPFLLRDSLSLANLGGDFGVIGNEPAVPTSEGRSYGLEVLFQQRPYKGFYGIVAYTLGWSEFKDKEGNFVPSSWDARHIVNLTLGKKIGRSWEVGINWRFQSGLPTTPFAPGSDLVLNYDRNGNGIPDYNRINSGRQDAVNTLDFRIDKKWFYEKWSLNLYLDIENVLGSAVGDIALVYDQPLDETGMPIGDPIIVNPNAPIDQQRYLLKELQTSSGTTIPSIGVMVEY
jgi:hypothetical protein